MTTQPAQTAAGVGHTSAPGRPSAAARAEQAEWVRGRVALETRIAAITAELDQLGEDLATARRESVLGADRDAVIGDLQARQAALGAEQTEARTRVELALVEELSAGQRVMEALGRERLEDQRAEATALVDALVAADAALDETLVAFRAAMRARQALGIHAMELLQAGCRVDGLERARDVGKAYDALPANADPADRTGWKLPI